MPLQHPNLSSSGAHIAGPRMPIWYLWKSLLSEAGGCWWWDHCWLTLWQFQHSDRVCKHAEWWVLLPQHMAGPALLVNSRSLFNVAQLGSPWPVQQSKIPEGAWEHNFYLMPKLYFKLLEFRCSVAFWRAGHMSCPEVVVGLMWWGRHWVNIAASWEHKICLSEVSSVFPHSTVLNESADGSKYRPR